MSDAALPSTAMSRIESMQRRNDLAVGNGAHGLGHGGDISLMIGGRLMDEPFDLDRFVTAQEGIYQIALGEIRRGSKRSHWMWFIFPQLAGLGRSATAQRYAIGSIDEAKVYLGHAILGARLQQCVTALQDLTTANAQSVFGAVDAPKLRSSLTLFIEAGAGPLYHAALQRWFGNEPDPMTLQLLRS
jgi:uncharacterized protein (DUF1810 family)